MEKSPEFDTASLLYGSFYVGGVWSSHQRPVSALDNERFTVQCLLERGPAPFVLVRLIFYMFYVIQLTDVFL